MTFHLIMTRARLATCSQFLKTHLNTAMMKWRHFLKRKKYINKKKKKNITKITLNQLCDRLKIYNIACSRSCVYKTKSYKLRFSFYSAFILLT